MKWILVWSFLLHYTPTASSLTIVRHFIGGERGPRDIGSGNLIDIFNAAADIWEEAIPEPYQLLLHCGWAPVGGGQHTLNRQEGNPSRETEGTILLNNDDHPGHIHFYLDPTPRDNEEYLSFVETDADYGVGRINAARYFTDPAGDAASFEHVDLLSVVLHEIGHSLGLSLANSAFIAESVDLDIDITAPRPFAGIAVRLLTNNFGVDSHLSTVYGNLMAGTNQRERRIPSALDILVNAQLSQFNDINLPFAPRLALERSGCKIRLSWREIVPGFVLQQNPALKNTNAWQAVSGDSFRTNGVRSIILQQSSTNFFFRLRR